MKNYFYVYGQIRAQESKLLNVSRLDRMIGAKTPEDAFRVFMELQYADYVDDVTQAKDFALIIKRGLNETKEMLVSGTDNAEGLQFLWLQFDLNNLKRALKLKYLEQKNSIENFSDNYGFSRLGNASKEELEALVFAQEDLNIIPKPVLKVVREVETILEKNNNEFRFVEYALDQVFFEVLSGIAKRSCSGFLKNLFKFLVDTTNFRNTVRSVLILGEKLPEEAWIQFGTLSYDEALKIENQEDLVRWIRKTPFSNISSIVKDDMAPEVCLVRIEKKLDEAYQNFLQDSVLKEAPALQIPFTYFEKRLRNARLLKFVMFAKFHDIDPKEIYKTLETF